MAAFANTDLTEVIPGTAAAWTFPIAPCGTGNDAPFGGLGRDTLQGGPGRDRFEEVGLPQDDGGDICFGGGGPTASASRGRRTVPRATPT